MKPIQRTAYEMTLSLTVTMPKLVRVVRSEYCNYLKIKIVLIPTHYDIEA